MDWDPGAEVMMILCSTVTASLRPFLFQAYTRRSTGWVLCRPESRNRGWDRVMFLTRARLSDNQIWDKRKVSDRAF